MIKNSFLTRFFKTWNMSGWLMILFGGVAWLCDPSSELLTAWKGIFYGGLLVTTITSPVVLVDALRDYRGSGKITKARDVSIPQTTSSELLTESEHNTNVRILKSNLQAAAWRHHNAEGLIEQAISDIKKLEEYECAIETMRKFAHTKAFLPLLEDSYVGLAEGIYQNSSDILVLATSGGSDGDLSPDTIAAIQRELDNSSELMGIFKQTLEKAGQSSIQKSEKTPFSGIELKSGLTAVEAFAEQKEVMK